MLYYSVSIRGLFWASLRHFLLDAPDTPVAVHSPLPHNRKENSGTGKGEGKEGGKGM
jgi:hypothetical protein